MSRKIYGGKKLGDVWEARTNQEPIDLYCQPIITTLIKMPKIRWLGHVYRLPPERTTDRVLIDGVTGRSCLGRPRTKWIRAIGRDLFF